MDSLLILFWLIVFFILTYYGLKAAIEQNDPLFFSVLTLQIIMAVFSSWMINKEPKETYKCPDGYESYVDAKNKVFCALKPEVRVEKSENK